MGLENHSIQSGDDYANLLIGDLRIMVEQEGMEEDLFKVWEKHIRKLCNLRYYQYVSGDVESFMLSEQEMMQTYKDSTMEYTGEILSSLVEKGEVSMSVSPDGEILYGIPKNTIEEWQQDVPRKNRRTKKNK
jgi:hypothetical protein